MIILNRGQRGIRTGACRRLVINIEVDLDNHCFVCRVKKTGTFRERRIDDGFIDGFRGR